MGHSQIIPPRLTTPVPQPLKDALKIEAVRRGISLKQLIQKILQDWMDEHASEKAA